MKEFSGFEWLLIDLANNFGLDKVTFEERISWSKTNFKNIDTFIDQADGPYLFQKSILAIREVMKGKASGHIVKLDAVCSGIQLMSALTGCVDGSTITGLVCPNTRYDAYAEVCTQMNKILTEDKIQEVHVSRPEAKEAVMTAAYGSRLVPERIFGQYVHYFYDAANQVAPGAFWLMDVLIESWNKGALSHQWSLPDGFQVYVPVMETLKKKAEIDELWHYEMTVQFKENKGTSKGLSNAANVIHSIDAYVLRTMVRYCTYNKALLWWTDEITATLLSYKPTEVTNKSITKMINWGIVDITILDHIDSTELNQIPKPMLIKLNQILTKMSTYKPFELVTVHDAFGSHANNCNIVRYWYKEILADLADSNVLEVILNTLYRRQSKFTKFGDISTLIRNSNYGLC